MSPEVIKTLNPTNNSKNNPCSPAVDIWSLGCILYEILNGIKLFKCEPNSQNILIKPNNNGNLSNREEIIEKILKFKYVYNDKLSNEANDLLSKMLKTKEKDRISVDDCINHAWVLEKLLKNKIISKTEDFNNFDFINSEPNSEPTFPRNNSSQINSDHISNMHLTSVS